MNLKLFPPSLAVRSTEPELMDNSECDIHLLEKTVRQFSLLNFLFTASRKLIKKKLFPHFNKTGKATISLLDIGAGGCDLDIWIVREVRKMGLKIAITALDHDERVLNVARRKTMLYPEIRLVHGSVTELAALGRFDFVFSNHLLHHLDTEAISALLAQLFCQTDRAFLLNDLRRSVFAYVGYGFFTVFFLAHSLAYKDGLLSIRKGFTRAEWSRLLETRFPGRDVAIIGAFPARLVLYWDTMSSIACR